LIRAEDLVSANRWSEGDLAVGAQPLAAPSRPCLLSARE
jgi:hypothetical protein